MRAAVKTEKGRPRVLQVGLRNILNPVEGAVLVPVEDPRDIRKNGVVTETCGLPTVARKVETHEDGDL